MRELTSDERRRELGFIQDSDRWPNWPLLPVKQYKGGMRDWPQFGVILANGFPEIIPVGLYELIGLSKDEAKQVWDQWVVYPSWDALLDDGWVVD